MILRTSFPLPWVHLGMICSIVACTTPTSPWEHWEVEASIRSLDVHDDHHVRYAGSNGWVGQTLDGGLHWNHAQWMAPDSTRPSFRASAFSGDHWHAVSIASPAWIARCLMEDMNPEWVHHDTTSAMFLDAMAWWDDREGLVFGDPVDGCLTLLKTTNAGTHWNRIPCENLPLHDEGEAGFAASNGNICIQGETAWVFTGGVTSRCWRSRDRGASWEAIQLPIRQGESMTGVFGASFASPERGLAIGGHWEHPEDNRGNLIETRDGGNTWALISEGNGPGYRSCIVHHPADPKTVVATGFKGLDVSMDGGLTWEHVSDSSRYVARFSPGGRTLWLAGNHAISRVSWPLPQSSN